MALTTDATSTRRFGRRVPAVALAEVRKPAYAVAGLADLALQQAKIVPAELSSHADKVSARLAEVPAAVRTLPTQVKGLRGDVEVRVQRAQLCANQLYAELALRGERLVTQIRRQPATGAAIAEGKEAVRKAEAAATATRKSAQAGEKAVQAAAGTLG